MTTRGTTPTQNFIFPFDCSDITVLSIAYAQNGTVLFTKNLEDVFIQENTISVTLTEDETLMFNDKQGLEIQLRWVIGDNKQASNIIRTDVGRILEDGVLK